MQGRATTDAEKLQVIERLLEVWRANPQMRLAQVIGNVYPCGIVPTEAWELPTTVQHKDPYNVEDFPFIESLERASKMWNTPITKKKRKELEKSIDGMISRYIKRHKGEQNVKE